MGVVLRMICFVGGIRALLMFLPEYDARKVAIRGVLNNFENDDQNVCQRIAVVTEVARYGGVFVDKWLGRRCRKTSVDLIWCVSMWVESKGLFCFSTDLFNY
jgi:hypothetical protein